MTDRTWTTVLWMVLAAVAIASLVTIPDPLTPQPAPVVVAE